MEGREVERERERVRGGERERVKKSDEEDEDAQSFLFFFPSVSKKTLTFVDLFLSSRSRLSISSITQLLELDALSTLGLRASRKMD